VRWADEFVLAAECADAAPAAWMGSGWDAAGNEDQNENGCDENFNIFAALKSSTEDLDVTPSKVSGARAKVYSASAAVQPAWLLVLCDARVLLIDVNTKAIVDVPHAALLVESTSSGGRAAPARGRPGVTCATIIGAGVIAFGCEDGAIRVWAADANCVVQVVRPGGGGGGGTDSGRPIMAMRSAVSRAAINASSPASAPVGLLLVGALDGVCSLWEVGAGRVLTPVAHGAATVRLSAELVDLDLSPVTGIAVAISADRNVWSWDIFSAFNNNGFAPGAAPAGARLSSGSAAAEGGLGSKLLSIRTLGAHAFFPPSAVLVTGKGPHLEVAIPGASPPRGAQLGGAPLTGDAGTIFYDLRTAREGLPSKLKIYALASCASRMDLVAAGTNIGVFVLSIAPAYTMSAASVAPPSWLLSPSRVPDVAHNSVARIRAGAKVLHVTRSGALAVAHVAVLSDASAVDRDNGRVVAKAGGGRLAHSPGSVSQSGTILIANFAPSSTPPPTLTPSLPGAPPPPVNALAVLAALTRNVAPGLRGVRLRVSGSGRYVAAVWPDARSYSVYKIAPPAETSTGIEQGWSAVLLSGGAGVDVAWSCPGARMDDRAAGSPPVDRLAVIVPGAASTGRGPMGGGSSIGASAASGAKAGGKGISGGAGGLKITWTPPTLSLLEFEVMHDAHATTTDPLVLASDVALSGEPVALWSGPLLAVALAAEGATAGGTAVAGALASASLAFFSWTLLPPSAEKEAPAQGSDSRYSGAAKAKGALPRLAVAGGGGTFPAPSFAGSVGGFGVAWCPRGARVAIATTSGVHMGALVRAAAPRGGGGAAAGVSLAVTQVARAPIVVSSGLLWVGGGLIAAHTGGGAGSYVDGGMGIGGAISLIVPPVFDVRNGAGASGGGLGGSALDCIIVPLVADAPPRCGASFAALAPSPYPHPARAAAGAFLFGAAPLCVARGALAWGAWCGDRVSPLNGGLLACAVSLAAPGLRSLLAAASAGAEGPAQGAAAVTIASFRSAAAWGARVDLGAHDALAGDLSRMGASAAALRLPGLTLGAGLGIALGLRSAVCAGPAVDGVPRLDTLAAGAVRDYLSHVLRRASPAALASFALAPCPPIDSDDALHAALVEGESNVVGVWPAVASLLLVAAHRDDLESTRRDIAFFAKKLLRAGLDDDALLISALLPRATLAASSLTGTSLS
jgi:hypothetical protein